MKNNPKPRPFWLDVLLIVAGVSVLGVILSLVSNTILSNVYFISAFVCLLIAAVPIFTEIGGNTRTSMQARREGKMPREAIQNLEKAGKYSRGTRITFLFGISGFICFVLAFLSL